MASNIRQGPSWVTPMLVERVLAASGDLQERALAAPSGCAPPKGRYPEWTAEEDRQLSEAYATGARIDHLAERLGRTYKGTVSRASKLGLSHPREIKGGFITSPKWTLAEDMLLRELYGNVPTRTLSERIGRSKTAIFNRAHALGLHHGYQRCWTKPELKALRVAFDRGIAIADLAAALGRKAFSVSKYASNHGLSFGIRPLVLVPLTLQDILALEDPSVPLPQQADPRHGRSRSEHKQLIRDAAKRERQQKRDQAKLERGQAKAAERASKEEAKRLAKLAARKERERAVAQAAVERASAAQEKSAEGRRRASPLANARRSASIRRSIERKAAALLDGDKSVLTTGGRANSVLAGAVIAVAERRAAEARMSDPLEQAKLALQRRGKVVHSMAVWGGRADRFFITGLGKDVTPDQLLEAAARLAA